MKIELRNPQDLIPYENNSKEHPQEQVEAIARSIQEFGFDQPIVIDQKGVIIKGHGRRLAAIHLGLEEVPVVVRDISPNEARFLREVDNQIQSVEWDVDNLATELLELKEAGKLELTLFTEEQIPELPQLNVTAESANFDLTTKHTCNQCAYKW